MGTSRYTLLFVDDEPDVLDILTRLFERRHEVLTATSGPEALALLRSQAVDLLVTDQKMPDMTGLQLVAAARGEGIDVPALLLTAYTDPTDLIAAINSGHIYRYLTKPWDVNELLVTVNQALEFAQLRRDKERLLEHLHRRLEALNVFHEVSRTSAGDAPSYDAVVERFLSAVTRVLPYDCAAALVEVGEGRSATLRLRCQGPLAEAGLLSVKEATLHAFREQSGRSLAEDRLMVRVGSAASRAADAATSFASRVHVPLTAQGQQVGTLSLFSRQPHHYGVEDAELLDTLANQTTSAILSLRAAEDEQRRRMERMVESMADGVLLTDEKNEIVVVNPAARALLHLSDDPREWTSRHLQQTLGFYPFELVRGWEYGGKKVLREEVRIFERTVQSTVTPVDDGRGTLRGVCVTLRDITEQKQLEERKDEFVSMVSHELRTPLTSIAGALDLVLSGLTGEMNDKQRRYLGMARESTDKLNAIVDDLLDLSKAEQGRLKMSFEVTWLDELVAKAVERYGPACLERRLHLTMERPRTPLRILADPNRLGQVLNNLLTNSVKFTPEGGDIRVALSASGAAPGFATLTVWNSGEPIAEGDLERIFDRFEQARTQRTRTVRGTGLGLAICRNIVEAHGGRIWAEPSGSGARFVVVLPAEPAPELIRGEAPPAAPASKPAHVRGRVLVVEDDADTAYVVKALLLGRGDQVLLATTANEGLALARRHRPDLIVVDVRLPDLDGLALAEIFKHDPDTRHCPQLVLSALDERERVFRLGLEAFLTKPLQPDTFLATVEGLLRGPGGRKQGRVLVVDDDLRIASICDEVLRNLGFEVACVGSLAQARDSIRQRRPDVLLLDLMLPDGDGFELLEELKAERASAPMSVIFISARGETASKVRALKLGGDDYLTKPFDALELGARVESVLRRREQELGASPTTQLPGSNSIEREVQRRVRAGTPFALCYLDLDNLKAYNDCYGFAKADGVIRQTGDLLRDIFAQEGEGEDFLGHVAGDDFVFITSLQSVDRICSRAVADFDRIIPLYYDSGDRERGHIEAEDRYGERRHFPLMSVSVVAIISDGVSADHAELSRQAAELKRRAKTIQGSVYLRSDREAAVRSAG